MAKETKAERMEREAQEETLRLAKEEQDYIPSMMVILERACKACFEITVKDVYIVVMDRTDPDKQHLIFPQYSCIAQQELDNLGWSVSYKEEEIEESNRKYMLKQAALNKLSKEEKEVLGIA